MQIEFWCLIWKCLVSGLFISSDLSGKYSALVSFCVRVFACQNLLDICTMVPTEWFRRLGLTA